tara:strand:- start:178 stop:387 length:210 start_codon:yes stop_codon:yes gene_type:complete
MIITLLNIIILLMVFLTFFILVTGLIKTARSDNTTSDESNKFMRFRVYFQLVAIIILIAAIYAKKQLVG